MTADATFLTGKQLASASCGQLLDVIRRTYGGTEQVSYLPLLVIGTLNRAYGFEDDGLPEDEW